MGIVFGITGTQEPSYQLLRLPARLVSQNIQNSFPYEIRKYESFFVAEVPMNEGEDNGGFGELARYYNIFNLYVLVS